MFNNFITTQIIALLMDISSQYNDISHTRIFIPLNLNLILCRFLADAFAQNNTFKVLQYYPRCCSFSTVWPFWSSGKTLVANVGICGFELEPCNPTRTRPDPMGRVGSGRVQNSRGRVGSGLTMSGFCRVYKIT